jgi:kinesin family protein C1
MGPPSSFANGINKHKLSNRAWTTAYSEEWALTQALTRSVTATEPPTKRKTLVDRAGEPPPRSGIPSKPSYGSSSTAGFGIRPTTTSTSSYHHPNRSVTNLASASSIGSVRTASNRQANANANAFRQTAPTRPPSAANVPLPDQDQESDGDSGVQGTRKGTTILSFNPPKTITLRKTRIAPGDNRQQHRAASDARSQHSGSHTDSDCASSSVVSSRSVSASSTSSAPPPAPHTSKQNNHQGGPVGARQTSRNVSLIAAFEGLSLTPQRNTSARHRPSLERINEEPSLSPSKIPKFSCQSSLRPVQSLQDVRTPSPIKKKASNSGLRTPLTAPKNRDMPVFLTKEMLTPVAAWDVNGRLGDIEKMYNILQTQMQTAANSKDSVDESIAVLKSRVQELTEENRLMTTEKKSMTADLERARNELHTTSTDLRQARRDQEREMHDLERKHERELADLQAKREKEEHRLERAREKDADRVAKVMDEAKKEWERQKDSETADLTSQHWDEMETMREDHDKALTKLQKEIDSLQQAGQSRASESATEVQTMRETITSLQSQLDASNETTTSLRRQITAFESRISTLESEKASLKSQMHFLEGNQEMQSAEFTTMRAQLQSAVAQKDATLETLRKEEMLRRKLNAMILELRGNIRVFVRTRPLLNGEDDPAKVDYVDEDSLDGCKEMVVHANPEKTATGKQRNEKHNYAFDRVFTPGSSNTSVFEECQDLIQSVVDGYNVSILSYGQTGSGKTYGMSGPEGIIPSSIKLLLNEMQRLKEKGWEYAVEASFVEVYNETLNDLLGDAKKWDEDNDLGVSTRGKRKEKHEIHHDAITGKTTVSNLTTQSLWPPPTDEGSWPPPAPVDGDEDVSKMAPETYTEKAVTNLLDTAAKNRRVAATKANERSSRSHSIFMLTLKGSCAATGESSEGILNLVDLAGSERLKQSGAEGSRMKETQAINKSLSSLGDVIASLGAKGGKEDAHVPYRNSKVSVIFPRYFLGRGGESFADFDD